MPVKIRMKRFGRTHRPFFRVVAIDRHKSRDGRVIEELGSYDPHEQEGRKIRLNLERVQYWLGVGAKPSETVASFLKRIEQGKLSAQPVEAPSARPAEAAKEAAPAPEAAEQAAAAPEAKTPEAGDAAQPAQPEPAAPQEQAPADTSASSGPEAEQASGESVPSDQDSSPEAKAE